MWRFAFLSSVAAAVIAATAASALADAVSYLTYVEDFEDGAGNPGFSYPFLHEIEISPYAQHPPAKPVWGFMEDPYYPDQGTVLALGGGTQDSITFALSGEETIVYASVEVQIWGNPVKNDNYSIDFIGESGTRHLFLAGGAGRQTLALSSEAVGSITCLQLRAPEGRFDNVTIHVVPEPRIPLVLFLGVGAFIVLWTKRICRT
jgi:hypothetical protein